MSCYLVSESTIALIATEFCKQQNPGEIMSRKDMYNYLLASNLRSLAERYGDSMNIPEGYEFFNITDDYEKIEVLGAIHNFLYQATEDPQYKEVRAILKKLEHRVVEDMIYEADCGGDYERKYDPRKMATENGFTVRTVEFNF